MEVMLPKSTNYPSMITSQSNSHFGPNLPPIRGTQAGRRRSSRAMVVTAESIRRSNSYGSGRIVDEGMISLRKRIHEMKVIEYNYAPPSHWFDWEKQIYASYDDIICRGVGFVQARLMNLRPSVAIAVLALVGLSVPTSVVLLVFRAAAFVSGGIAAAGACSLGV